MITHRYRQPQKMLQRRRADEYDKVQLGKTALRSPCWILQGRCDYLRQAVEASELLEQSLCDTAKLDASVRSSDHRCWLNLVVSRTVITTQSSVRAVHANSRSLAAI